MDGPFTWMKYGALKQKSDGSRICLVHQMLTWKQNNWDSKLLLLHDLIFNSSLEQEGPTGYQWNQMKMLEIGELHTVIQLILSHFWTDKICAENAFN